MNPTWLLFLPTAYLSHFLAVTNYNDKGFSVCAGNVFRDIDKKKRNRCCLTGHFYLFFEEKKDPIFPDIYCLS